MADLVDVRDIAVYGDPQRARDTATSALTSRGFTLTWTDHWSAKATKGRKSMQVVLGAMAQYFEIRVSVFAAEGGSIIRIGRPSSGFTGGVIGQARATKQFNALVEELLATFHASGVLLPRPST